MQVYETPVMTSEMHGLISSGVESMAYSSNNMLLGSSEGEMSSRSGAIMGTSYQGLGNNWKSLNVQENRPSTAWTAPSIVVPSNNIQGLATYSGQNMTNSLLVAEVVEGAGSSLDVKADSTEGASHTPQPDPMQFYFMKSKYPDDHSNASPRTSMMDIHSTTGLTPQEFGTQKSLLEVHYTIPGLTQTSASTVSPSIRATHSQWLRGGTASDGNDLPGNGNMQHNQIVFSDLNNTLNWANRRTGSQTWSREPSSFLENKVAEYMSGAQEARSAQGLSLSLSYHQPSELHHLQELGNHANVLQMDGDAKPKSEDLDLFRATQTMSYLSSYSRDEMSAGKGIMNSLQGRPSMVHVNGGAMHGLFLGQATSLKSSVYLRAAQDLLYEFCNVGVGVTTENSPKRKPSSMTANFIATTSGTRTLFSSGKSEAGMNQDFYSGDRLELQRRKAKLVSMLEEVDRRYKHYRNQMQAVIGSFESLTTLGCATPYTALALKAMSRHFRCLRDAISNQIQIASKSLGESNSVVPGTTRGETPRLGFLERSMRQQRALQQLGMMEQVHPWRPQRGLPERSVSLLRAWLFEHFLHPYPTDADKHILARQTGLTRSQVSNWFINARVRLWKPMVEEMYLEETKEAKMDSANAKDAQHTDEKAKSDRSNSDEKSAFKSGGSDSQYTASEDAAAAFKLQDHSSSTAVSQSIHPESFGSMALHRIPSSHQRHKADEMKNPEVALMGESHESLSVMSVSQRDCMRLDQPPPYKKIEDGKGFRTDLYTNKLHQPHHETEIPLDFSSYNIANPNSMAAYSHEHLQPRNFPNSGVSLTLGLHHSGGISFPLGSHEEKYDSNIYFSRDDTANQYSMLNNEGNGYMEQGLPYRNYINGGRLLHDFVG